MRGGSRAECEAPRPRTASAGQSVSHRRGGAADDPLPEIDRTTLNSWEDPDFRAAVENTGRKKIITTGLWTEVCVAFPTLDMLREGYEVYPVSDAIGGVSTDAHDRAMQRMVAAGAQPVTAISLTAELQRDWGRPGADRLRSILRWYFPELEKIT